MKKIIIIFAAAALAFMSCKENQGANTADAVLENIATRTSIRAYTDQEVPDEIIEKLLRAGMAAPTAMNIQPWEFVVLKDRAELDSLAGKLRYAKMLSNAPLAIVVCAHTQQTMQDGKVLENKFWEHDASAATENILLAAHALGLGAVWTAASDDRAPIIREALGIPETVSPLCVIPIGYPAEAPAPKDKWKPEKIHYGKW